jgi:hypothetical protein
MVAGLCSTDQHCWNIIASPRAGLRLSDDRRRVVIHNVPVRIGTPVAADVTLPRPPDPGVDHDRSTCPRGNDEDS